MNQYKLRSLLFRAGFCNEDGSWDTRPLFEQEHDNFQRFTELIIKECLDCCQHEPNDDPYDSYDIGYDSATQNIRKAIQVNFGIE